VIITEKAQQNRERNINLAIRVTAKEKELIERRMEQAGIKNLRAYLVKQAVDGYIIQLDLTDVNEMVRLLSNAANNINQIARRANQTGNIYAADIEELRERYNQLGEQVGCILRKLAGL
jgi:SepF-like predicted cell division protein (DUF552 family)